MLDHHYCAYRKPSSMHDNVSLGGRVTACLRLSRIPSFLPSPLLSFFFTPFSFSLPLFPSLFCIRLLLSLFSALSSPLSCLPFLVFLSILYSKLLSSHLFSSFSYLLLSCLLFYLVFSSPITLNLTCLISSHFLLVFSPMLLWVSPLLSPFPKLFHTVCKRKYKQLTWMIVPLILLR